MILRKIKTAIKIPLRQKLWFFILYPISGIARLASLILSLKKIFNYLGYTHSNKHFSLLATEEQVLLAHKIGKTATLVSRYVPWESKCLLNAIMVKTLLKYYQIPYVIYIGMKKNHEDNKNKLLLAHAWIKVKNAIVVGNDGSNCAGYSINCAITSEKFDN